MILDTSALLAILLREGEANDFPRAMEGATEVKMSVASYLEAAIYVDRHGDEVRHAMLDTLLEGFSIKSEPVTVEQARMARQAFQLFGKGHHPAALNYGDCFTYALAKATREPLLFKGQDFDKTDVVSAVWN